METDLLAAGSGEDDGDRGGGDGCPKRSAGLPVRFRDGAANGEQNNDAAPADRNAERERGHLPPEGLEDARPPSLERERGDGHGNVINDEERDRGIADGVDG